MEKISTLSDLMIEQIRELYNAEKQQRNVLGDLRQLAHCRDLKMAIQNHLVETEQHVIILENIFRQLDVTSFGEHSNPMKELIREGYGLIDRTLDPEVSDIGLVTTLQYIEHFEIAGYGSACTFAAKLGLNDIAGQLRFILNEEKRIDRRLSEIAMDQINRKAAVPVFV